MNVFFPIYFVFIAQSFVLLFIRGKNVCNIISWILIFFLTSTKNNHSWATWNEQDNTPPPYSPPPKKKWSPSSLLVEPFLVLFSFSYNHNIRRVCFVMPLVKNGGDSVTLTTQSQFILFFLCLILSLVYDFIFFLFVSRRKWIPSSETSSRELTAFETFTHRHTHTQRPTHVLYTIQIFFQKHYAFYSGAIRNCEST